MGDIILADHAATTDLARRLREASESSARFCAALAVVDALRSELLDDSCLTAATCTRLADRLAMDKGDTSRLLSLLERVGAIVKARDGVRLKIRLHPLLGFRGQDLEKRSAEIQQFRALQQASAKPLH